jgi:MFS superfamily sulfate permease-like transporter
VDVSGARMLSRLQGDLAAQGIRTRLVGAHGAVRDMLRVEGLEERVGEVSRRIALDDVVREFEAGR